MSLPFGKFPFKHLGVPLNSKSLAVIDCEKLMDKMTCRIRGWQGKQSSYAARLQLVNFFLMSITIYWCQIFVLPKKVIKVVNALCRAFLWKYNDKDMKPVYTKGGRWMIFNPPPISSWVNRKLCKVKDHMNTWVNSATYNIKTVYKELIGSSAHVSWSKLVWHRISLPKASFIFWMTMLNKLKIKDHLMRSGVTPDDCCPLCCMACESIAHLFFSCSFSCQ
ncbi:uncharacterized protein LOC130823325 [Amaranthus tricolor]|uniref:uncharacterized protein LOC130823325 n=1 Tax=Amaranthus tricolor TaxID=29722 RepID=UPI00258EED9D|nr:uncharacterized protein LOC130823325 [Amaranthus tricolor]